MTTPFIIVPLYMYPLELAWEPLFQAARAHRELRFVAVVNPASGPGAEALPDGSYIAALRRFADEPNIQAVGYVHCSYGRRPAAAICADMDLYCGWRLDGRRIMDGIFFDEAPSDDTLVDYMDQLAQHAKETWRLQAQDGASSAPDDARPEAAIAGETTGRDSGDAIDQTSSQTDALVIYNPGVAVSLDFFKRCDHVVVFEGSEDEWQRRCIKQPGLDPIVKDQQALSKAVAIIHSCKQPLHRLHRWRGFFQNTRSTSNKHHRPGSTLAQMRTLGLKGIYLTDQLDGGYTRWPAAWMQVADAVAQWRV